MNEIKIRLLSGDEKIYPRGTHVQAILQEYPELKHGNMTAALVNNELMSLSHRLETDADIVPVYSDDPRGSRVYRQSLSYLLSMAASECLPSRRLIISHSLGNGYYYYYEDGASIPEEEIRLLKTTMEAIVREERPIYTTKLSYTQAMEHFEKTGQEDRRLLLEYRNDSQIPVYQCGDFWDMSFEALVDNTAKLRYFDLMAYDTGMILRYPKTEKPESIAPFLDNPILYGIYKEYKAWGKILNIDSVGKLNKKINEGNIKDFIQVSEALHNKKIAEIADRIHEKKDTLKMVLIAGPSSSGKTTFTKKLAIQLRVLGFNPLIIGLDDYFVPREKTPRDSQGNYDYECLEAIDVELLNHNLLALFDGKEVKLPVYDFKTGSRKESPVPLKMESRNILLIEGIHGLNNQLTPLVKAEQKYKVYISALTQLNVDGASRISTTDNRLLRRIIRDNQFRGNNALSTLRMWESVRRGEKQNIFPYQNNADSAFNSALDYELAVLKTYAEPPLALVKPWHPEYAEARRLLNLLANFTSLPVKYIPMDSILREFIGDSDFKY